MRYAVILKGISLGEAEAKCRATGGTNIKVKPLLKQVYCDLDPAQASKLHSISGLVL